MRYLLFLFYVLSFPAFAELCINNPGAFPRTDLKVQESYIRIMPHPTLGGSAIVLGYPTVTSGQICCNVSHFDQAAWNNLLTGAQSSVSMSVAEFAANLPALPGTNGVMSTTWAITACQEMVDLMGAEGTVGPTYRVVSNPDRPDGARPMFSLEGTELVPMTVFTFQFYVAAGTVCEDLPVVRETPEGKYLYVRNSTWSRGIALCN